LEKNAANEGSPATLAYRWRSGKGRRAWVVRQFGFPTRQTLAPATAVRYIPAMETYTIIPDGGLYTIWAISPDGKRWVVGSFSSELGAPDYLRQLQRRAAPPTGSPERQIARKIGILDPQAPDTDPQQEKAPPFRAGQVEGALRGNLNRGHGQRMQSAAFVRPKR
jgi:hypothetical protein